MDSASGVCSRVAGLVLAVFLIAAPAYADLWLPWWGRCNSPGFAMEVVNDNNTTGRGLDVYTFGMEGLRSESFGTSGAGVVGIASASSGFTYGVYGKATDSPNGTGVYGIGTGVGVRAESPSGTALQVYGASDFTGPAALEANTAGNTLAVANLGSGSAITASSDGPGDTFSILNNGAGRGIWAYTNGTQAIRGESSGTAGSGVGGIASATSGFTYGAYGKATASSNGTGVYGVGGALGVKGESSAGVGVRAVSSAGTALEVDGTSSFSDTATFASDIFGHNLQLGSITPGDPGVLRIFNENGNEIIQATAQPSVSGGEVLINDLSGLPGLTLRGDLGTDFGAQIILNKEGGGTGLALEGSANSALTLNNNGGILSASLESDDGGYGSQGGDGGSVLRMFNGQSPNVETVTLDANNAGGGGELLLGDNIALNGANGGAYFAGNVGIGAPNPTVSLCVNGTGRATAWETGGCDLAESFGFSEPRAIQAGMVMVIDSRQAGHLTPSARSYDTKVAGVVSGAGGLSPGVKLGQVEGNGDGLPLALAGRVYCYVDATENAVEVGDLLTTANTPGYAMKAVDRERAFGAVLGKAMQPLPKGQKGLILVLVALQ